MRLAHLPSVDASAIAERGEREEITVADAHANELARAAALPGINLARSLGHLRNLDLVEVRVTRPDEDSAWAGALPAILAHRKLELRAVTIECRARAEAVHLRLQIDEIGLHARNPRHERPTLRWRIGTEDQEPTVFAPDLARIGKITLQLGVLAPRRVRKGAGAVGILAIERRPLTLQGGAARRLRERAWGQHDAGQNEERKPRQKPLRAREASLDTPPRLQKPAIGPRSVIGLEQVTPPFVSLAELDLDLEIATLSPYEGPVKGLERLHVPRTESHRDVVQKRLEVKDMLELFRPNKADMRSLSRIALLVLATAMSTLAGLGVTLAQEPDLIFRKSTTFRLLTPNDKLATYGIDDPLVQNVACHYTLPERGGVSGALGVAEQVSDVSLSCRQIGPIAFKGKFTQGDVVFQQSRSLLFKKVQIVRGCDEKRNVLVYLIYSDKLVEGSPKNSTSSVPIMPWGSAQDPAKCADWVTK